MEDLLAGARTSTFAIDVPTLPPSFLKEGEQARRRAAYGAATAWHTRLR